MNDKRTILVLEDDECVREMLCEVLSDHGYEVHGAENGESALDLLKQRVFDIIISDFSMPGMNGQEFVHEARLCFPGALIVGISGLPCQDSFLEAGADMFLKKPFHPLRLISLLPFPEQESNA
jgi:CheY-like chemotaxis protein